MEAAAITPKVGNLSDAEYGELIQRMNARFAANCDGGKRPIFTTDADLWSVYLGAFPEEGRQYHNCNACRSFVHRFGGLAFIQPDGALAPAMWAPQDAHGPENEAFRRMAEVVRGARITGVFVSSLAEYGKGKDGQWRHFCVKACKVHADPLKQAHEAAAEMAQNYANVRRALAELNPAVIAQAIALLESGQLHRPETALPGAKWLRDLQASLDSAQGRSRENLLWLAIAQAPDGFCHPRSGMLGGLLDVMAKTNDLARIKAEWGARMDTYRQSQKAPTASAVDQAERAVEALGLAPAFARRYVDRGDITLGAVVWLPAEQAPAAAKPQDPPQGGVFSHLKPAAAATPEVDIPPKTMTWEKFARDVLPSAARIHYRTPIVGRFCALTTAADPAAPPIVQWDSLEQRNPVSWAFPSPPARANEWNLTAGELVPVTAIVRPPHRWAGEQHEHHGDGVFLLLEGARDTRGLPGGGLFPEHLRGDLQPYRRTIEAHMNKLVVEGADTAAGFGIGLIAGAPWTELAAPKVAVPTGPTAAAAAPTHVHAMLVIDDSGSMRSYIHAARAAVTRLIEAMRAMPGAVDVTVTIFGSHARMVAERLPLDRLAGVEAHMTANSGQTALNDALHQAIEFAMARPGAHDPSTSYFLGIVTDGEENASRRGAATVARLVRQVQETGRWTIAYAGAGFNAMEYAGSIGIPPGNCTTFEASSRGFEDVGNRYAMSTRSLASDYASGQRASTNFFSASGGRQDLGKDLPVLVVTQRSGAKAAYQLDRWE